jgi:L-alanine-DL-glutamate epimerase-like enolase superfamily enzyme
MAMAAQRVDAPVERLEAAAYTVPTDAPESDGTLEWDSTTLVAVHAEAGGERGFGYTYAHAAAAAVIDDPLREVVEGQDASAIPAIWDALGRRASYRSAGCSALHATPSPSTEAAALPRTRSPASRSNSVAGRPRGSRA